MSPQRSIACPSCGAPKELRHPGIVMFACEHCGTQVYWDEDAVRAAGTKSLLDEGFTRLYRGATGSFRGSRFRVLGRVRYLYGQGGQARGFWDEWFLRTSAGEDLWLTEDDHELSLQKLADFRDPRPSRDYQPGITIHHDGREYFVEERGVAQCFGLEGELPEVWQIGETYPFVDLASPDGKYTLGLEFDQGDDEEQGSDDCPPTAFAGKWLQHSDLELDDEGTAW